MNIDIHSRHVPGDSSSCPECEIVNAHHLRFAEAAVEYGGPYLVPTEVRNKLQEQHRQDWLLSRIKHTDGDELELVKRFRKDKQERLTRFMRDHVGQRVTVEEFATWADCNEHTVYTFIRNQPGSFRKVGLGAWVVIDTVADRKASKVAGSPATIAQGPRNASTPMVTTVAGISTVGTPQPVYKPAKD